MGKLQQTFEGQRVTAWPLAVTAFVPCATLVWLVTRLPLSEQAVMSRWIVYAVILAVVMPGIIKALFWGMAKLREAGSRSQAPVARVKRPSARKGHAEMLEIVEGHDGNAKRRTLG